MYKPLKKLSVQKNHLIDFSNLSKFIQMKMSTLIFWQEDFREQKRKIFPLGEIVMETHITKASYGSTKMRKKARK